MLLLKIYNLSSQIIDRFTLGLLPKSLIGFGVIGLFGYCTHFAVLFSVNVFTSNFYICHFLASLTALTQNYILNRNLNFKSDDRSTFDFISKYFRFVLITSPGIILGGVTVGLIGIEAGLALAVMSLLASLIDFILRYLLSRFWIFKP
ncbi:MAG: GtrA family protein [Alphaproteobacteria bacterium]|nr:GtrA family protein [Alphaproteobacteria bacterium]